MKEYSIEDGNLVIRIPLKKTRYNLWDEEHEEPMDNLIGLYESEYNNGVAYRIDMAYKGKDDQWTDYVYKLNGTEEEFLKMCKDLGIGYVEL